MQEFNEKYRRMPYEVSPGQLDALRNRSIALTTGTTSTRRRGRARIAWTAALATVAAVVVTGIALLAGRYSDRTPEHPTYEQLLSSAPAGVLQRAAAENYDDLLYNQEL